MIETGLVIPDGSGGTHNSAFNIRQSISAALAETIPEGKTGAAGVVGDDSGAHAFIASKVGEHWQIVIGADMTKDGKHVSGSVKVAGSW